MDSIVTAILGMICIIIGLLNQKGNISMLHSYHRKRVSDKDLLPFGKLVGLGTIIIGVSLIVMSVFAFASALFNQSAYLIIGNAVFIIALVIGMGIIFYAMIKYNKGIF